MSRRSYDSSRRRAAADITHARVMTEARQLMIERGYHGATVADIAAAAEVSVPLVYATFGNKAGLLTRLLDVAIVGDTEALPLREREAVAAIRSAATVADQCALMAALVTGVHGRTAALYPVLTQAAAQDPAVARMHARQEAGRREGMAEFVAALDGAGRLRPDLPVQRAVDIVWTLCDPAVYQRLVVDCHWTDELFRDWLADALHHQLAPRGAASSPRR